MAGALCCWWGGEGMSGWCVVASVASCWMGSDGELRRGEQRVRECLLWGHLFSASLGAALLPAGRSSPGRVGWGALMLLDGVRAGLLRDDWLMPLRDGAMGGALPDGGLSERGSCLRMSCRMASGFLSCWHAACLAFMERGVGMVAAVPG